MVPSDRGPLAQLVERHVYTVDVVGSIPAGPTTRRTPRSCQDPLYTAERAFLTPHIAGSYGTELGRLGESVVEELVRLTEGRELAHRLLPTRFAVTA